MSARYRLCDTGKFGSSHRTRCRYLALSLVAFECTDGMGYEVFNVSNDDMSVGITSDRVIEQFYQGVEVRGEMDANETFFSNKKAKKMVGFQPKHSWRDAVD